MKKIYLSAIPLLILLMMASCSNDEIVIETVDPIYSLTLNISSQKMYDELDVTSDIKNSFLREEGYEIGIFSYVYDKNGDIVDSLKTTLKTFNTAVQTLPKLVEGDYTVITIETLVNTDKDNMPESWIVEDAKSISTIKLRQLGLTFWSEAVGMETTHIRLESDKEVNITPKAVGSIIHHFQYDFEESDFIKVGFATDGITDYYSLNPQLPSNDRVKVDLTKKGYINVRLLDEVEENSNYTGSIYIIESEITWMNVAQDEEDNNNNVYTTWPSNNAKLEDGKNYYAVMYYLYSENDATYAASYLGDLDGISNFVDEMKEWKEKNIVTNLFTAPYTNWNNGTVSAVKSYMSNFTLYQDILFDEDTKKYDIIFFDTSNYTMYSYEFTSSTAGLTDAYVYLDGDDFSLDQVLEEVVKQGYTYNSQNNNNYYYTGSSTYVTVYQSSSGLILVNYYNPKAYGLAPKFNIPMHDIDIKPQSRTGIRKSSLCPVRTTMNAVPFTYKNMKKAQFK